MEENKLYNESTLKVLPDTSDYTYKEGDKVNIKSGTTFKTYILGPGRVWVRNQGVTDDEQSRIDKLTTIQADKLVGLNTQTELENKINNATALSVSSLIPVTSTSLPRGTNVPSYITTKGKATLRGGDTADITYSNTGVTATPTITVKAGYERDAFYDKATDTWTAGLEQKLPSVDTTNFATKTSVTDLENNLYGTGIILYKRILNNSNVAPDVIGSINTGGYLLGTAGVGQFYAPPTIPAGTYTCYVKINITNRGQLNNMAYFNRTTTLGSVDLSTVPLNQDYEFAYPLVIPEITTGIISQIRSRYPLDATNPGTFIIKDWSIFNGAHTLQEIKDSFLPLNKEKVNVAKLADKATTASTAEIANTLSGDYFVRETDNISKVKNKYNGVLITDWNSTTGSTTWYATRNNNKLQVGGTANPYTGSSGSHRLWFGIDVTPAVYATTSKTYYIVVRGTAKVSGIRNLILRTAGSRISVILLQDMSDNVVTPFQAVIEITYPLGTSTNDRYIMTDYTSKIGVTSISMDLEFDVYSLFEKNSITQGFTDDDFFNAALGTYEVLNERLIPETVATKTYVNEKISEITSNIISSPKSWQFSKYGINMIVGYGQSLNTGGGATNGNSYVGNSVAFNGGLSIASFTTSSVPDSDLASFVPLNEAPASRGGAPIGATLVSFISLLEKENGVIMSSLGNKYLALTAGVSGNSIESHKKGTQAYINLMQAITKGKQVANTQGQTFGFQVLCWVQGEADRGQSQSWYYTRLKQLFEDLNSDIKLITGQTEDVKFITYQTSPWKYRWYPSGSLTQQPGDLATGPQGIGIQAAQVQLANEMSNVYLSPVMYQFAYADFFHPVDRALVGLGSGIAMKRILVDNIDWKTFQPISHQIIGSGSNYFIHLKFDVPVKPARFDISGDAWHNPNGKQTNFGFKVLLGSTNIISSEPFLSGGDTVVIPVNTNPIGSLIEYAADGHFGGGNLCDSMHAVIRNKNIDYVIDNYAIGFDNYLIN